MRTKRIWLALLATAMVAGALPAKAATIDNNGDWSDWFALGTTATQLSGTTSLTNGQLVGMEDWQTSSNSYRINPFADIGTYKDPDTGIGYGGQNGPGVGGQPYDAEQIFYYADANTNTLHIGLITGFNPSGQTGTGVPNTGTLENGRFLAGDLFLHFGPQSGNNYDLAIGLSNYNGVNVPSRSGLVWGPSSFNHTNTLDVEYTAHSVANPFLVDTNTNSTNVDAVLTSSVVGATVSYGNYSTSSFQRFFYEISITGLNADALSAGLGYHWTMECGNDYIQNYDDGFTPPLDDDPPVVPVPAAAPMGLVGMIALGLFRKVRAKKS